MRESYAVWPVHYLAIHRVLADAWTAAPSHRTTLIERGPRLLSEAYGLMLHAHIGARDVRFPTIR